MSEFLIPGRPVLVARAPGRLDVMGGIADYSGSLVLELPLDRETVAYIQEDPQPVIRLASERDGRLMHVEIDSRSLWSGPLAETGALTERFRGTSDGWAAYVLGVLHYLIRFHDAPLKGLRMLIRSTVPEGKGVSSSAALEVATMMTAARLLDVALSPEELARACQWVENHVVGAPCGIMDQMTSACGRKDQLLRLLCRPASIEGHVSIPAGYRFFGIDSGIRHAVSGADYGTVRTAAFMGHRILGVDGYLAGITPDEFYRNCEELLPAAMQGSDFLDRYGATTDSVTRVQADRIYPVRQATAHPVLENARVHRFAELLSELSHREAAAPEMGALMYASHASYSACGLGSDGTDLLVDLVRARGVESGLYGAKITGGGSGGTVAIFAREEAASLIHDIATDYTRQTGRPAEIFSGSSPGAAETGVQEFIP